MGGMELIGSLAGTGAGLAGGLMDLQGRKKAHQKQQEALHKWYAMQNAFRMQERQRQEDLRNGADTSRLNTLYGDVSNIAQKNTLMQEGDRLNDAYAQGTSASSSAPSASDAAIRAGSQAGTLTGQGGGDQQFTSDLARRLNNATANTRDLIRGMATVGAYGNSMGGLGTVVPLAFARSAADINMFNNFRKGSLAAYGVEKAIEPEQIYYRQSPMSMGLSSLGGALSGMGGGGGGMGF
jgi:hypothetical protein